MYKPSNKFGSLWLAAALLVLISTPPARSAITDGVVAYWNFDNADFKDSVGLNGVKFDGTANGSNPIQFLAGKAGFGQAIQLDGVDQWVEITGGEPDDLAFEGGSLSVSAWFKVGTFDKSWQALVAKGEGGNWRIHRRGTENGMAFTGGPTGDTPTGTKDVNDDAWHHMVAITDAAAQNFGTALYIDGELYSQLDTAQVLAANGLRMAIGDNPGARARYWNGWVDDVAIWNRVLTDAEIASLYFSGAGKPLSSFLGPHVDTIVIAKGASEPDNVQVQIIDDGTAVFDPNAAANLNVTVDGTALPPTSKSKSGTTSLMNFNKQFYTSTSQVQVYVEAKDTNGKWTTNQLTFIIPTYPTIPPGYKLAAPATTPGMVAAQIYQIDFARTPSADENSVGSAEQQLARGFPVAGGTPYPNVAAQTSDNTVSVVNWARLNDLTGDYNITATPANGPDNFNDARPTNAPVPNVTIPGLPGTGSDQGHGGADAGSAWDNIVVETTAYMRLTRGAYQMGVNSDDGFKVTTSPAAENPFGLLLGQYSGGRGAANTTFWFLALEDGDYPVRLLWWQGAGGANVEWFVTDRTTGSRVLVNGAGSPIMTFRQGSGRAHVKSILPADRFDGVEPNSPIKIVLVDGSTTVVNGSISLTVDGSPVTPTIIGGATTTVTYNKPGGFVFGSVHTGSLIWNESTSPTATTWTNAFSFTVRDQGLVDLPANSFWIEAEDFDGPGDAAARSTASTMPYAGGAYDTLGARHDIDYHASDTGPFNGTPPDPDAPSSWLYRTGIPAELNGPNRYVPMDPQTGAGTLDVQRPGNPIFEATTNYKIGWAGGGEWYNYTRNIPNGLYKAVAALSHGDPLGTADRLQGSLSRVTAGVGTSNQTTVVLGTFNAPSSGGWGTDNLVTMKAAGGGDAVFKVTSSPTTLRFNTLNGDYDWFVVSPVSGVPPAVTVAVPANGAAVRRDSTLNFTIEDFSTAVVQNTVRLFLDGADVTSGATINKTADITTVTYDPAGLMDIGSAHNYALVFTDNGTPAVTKTNSASFTVNIYPTPGAFLIEAEDFNTAGGQTVATASTMPYRGNAYSNLNAIVGIDFLRPHQADSPLYRFGETNSVPLAGYPAEVNVPMDPGPGDFDRGEWTMTVNYKIGWTGANQWYNYTRTFAAGSYNVYASLSHGDPVASASRVRGTLQQITAGATTTNQTVVQLGTFDGPATGGWGVNRFVPLMSGGNVASVPLSGAQTIRFTTDSGDFDFLAFIPATAQIRINTVAVASGQVTVNWTGGVNLQSSPSLSAPNWQDIAGATTGTYTAPVAGSELYFRVRGP